MRVGANVVPDPEARDAGRGAYLCPRAECAERALRARGFNRSFRAAVVVLEDLIDLIEKWPRSESTR